MRIPGLLRQNRPREFGYKPLYYNPEKEAREERIRQIKEEMGVTDDASKTGKHVSGITRGSFKPMYEHKHDRMQRYTGLRLIVIILVLLLITYIFWRL